MQKVICDVCGTAYPATSDQCPICGCSKPAEESSETTYTYVKGGRFSKSNVRKRNKAAGITRVPVSEENGDYDDAPAQKDSRGLLIAVVLLLLAIAAVIIYIVSNLLGSGSEPETTVPTQQQKPTQSQTATIVTDPPVVDSSCTGLELEVAELQIRAAGDSVQISVQPQPADTTDALSFASSDPSVATVTDDGCVTAVAPGEAVITITCGNASATCKVVCDFAEEPTEPELSGNYAMFIDNVNAETRRYKNEVTMSINHAFRLSVKDLDTGEELEVEWVVEKTNVLTVNGTTVKAVAKGNTKITCTIGDETFTCIVRVTG